MTYSWCGSFKLPTVDEPDTKGDDKPRATEEGRRGGEPTRQGQRSRIFDEKPSLNPPLTMVDGAYGVEYRLPFKMCETGGERTGWLCTWGKFNTHRICAKHMTPLHRRLVENIHRINDGLDPLKTTGLSAEIPRRDSP